MHAKLMSLKIDNYEIQFNAAILYLYAVRSLLLVVLLSHLPWPHIDFFYHLVHTEVSDMNIMTEYFKMTY